MYLELFSIGIEIKYELNMRLYRTCSMSSIGETYYVKWISLNKLIVVLLLSEH